MDYSLEHVFKMLADIGYTPQGRNCLAYSPEEDLCHSLFADLLKELEIRPCVDAFGNTYGTYFPPDVASDTPAVAIGSHLDSVEGGGRYDGVLGVAAGVVLAHRIIEATKQGKCKPNAPMRIIAWRAEESDRFRNSCIGSKGASGKLEDKDLALRSRVEPMILLNEAISQRSGKDPSPVANKAVKCLLELHIEQGPQLQEHQSGQQDNKPFVGIVTPGIAGSLRFTIKLPPMKLHAVARMIVEATNIATDLDDIQQPFRATFTPPGKAFNVGRDCTEIFCSDKEQIANIVQIAKEMESKVDCCGKKITLRGPHTFHSGTHPMSFRLGVDMVLDAARLILKIPDSYCLSWPEFSCSGGWVLQLDVRAGDEELLEQGRLALEETLSKIHPTFLPVSSAVGKTKPVLLTKGIMDLFERKAKESGIYSVLMACGAGHDVQVPDVKERGLLLVPSNNGGVSHHHTEKTFMEDAQAGLQVLEGSVLELLQQ